MSTKIIIQVSTEQIDKKNRKINYIGYNLNTSKLDKM